MLKMKVEEVMDDFVTEIEVCCDLNHPNLARLLGYTEQPRLMMVQELLQFAVDQLLYVDLWKPTTEEVLKSGKRTSTLLLLPCEFESLSEQIACGTALDVAKGMAYLHTAFEMQSNHHSQPIIHRDLKTPSKSTPNLLLLVVRRTLLTACL
jgi:serine/threonine protein kinase